MARLHFAHTHTHARAPMYAQTSPLTCSPALQGRELHLQQNEGESIIFVFALRATCSENPVVF